MCSNRFLLLLALVWFFIWPVHWSVVNFSRHIVRLLRNKIVKRLAIFISRVFSNIGQWCRLSLLGSSGRAFDFNSKDCEFEFHWKLYFFFTLMSNTNLIYGPAQRSAVTKWSKALLLLREKINENQGPVFASVWPILKNLQFSRVIVAANQQLKQLLWGYRPNLKKQDW